MLIAISGSQGSGKSTILKRLEAENFRTINRKTSRSILKDWDVTLEEVPRIMQKFDVTQLIHGHTHRPAVHHLQINKFLIIYSCQKWMMLIINKLKI